MSLLTVKGLMDEFERSAAEVQRRKTLLRELFMQEADEEKRERKKLAEEKDREFREQLKAALATPAQLFDFTARLERYETATVEALMENRRALDRVHERLDQYRTEAHVLPDGRKVFATARRDAVFDESGARVGPDVIDPDAISKGKPVWEEFAAARNEEKSLGEERNGLLKFQQKLDDTRERVAAGGLRKTDIDDLDTALKAAMPKSLTGRLGDDHREGTGVSAPAADTVKSWAGQKQPGTSAAHRP